ncbi:MAG: hypothetical protein R2856_37845 [Caldilineaceae bacterium]
MGRQPWDRLVALMRLRAFLFPGLEDFGIRARRSHERRTARHRLWRRRQRWTP